MSKARSKRISEEIRKVVAHAIREEIKDPRVSKLSTVTKVETTGDLRYTTIYISVFESDEIREQTMEGLNKAKGYIRKLIGESLDIRYTPEPQFKVDNSMEYAMNMSKLIDKVHKEDEEIKKHRDELGLELEDDIDDK